MKTIKSLLCIALLSSIAISAQSQIEGGYARMKNFEAFGFGGFINVQFPIQEVDYLTFDLGLNWYKNQNDDDIAFAPLLVGYRYTLNRSGSGLFVEPFAGYTFGESGIEEYDENGQPVYDDNGEWKTKEIAGPAAGLMGGYLFSFENGNSLVLGLRYLHNFGPTPSDVVSLRLAYSFNLFGRRE